MVGRTLRLLLGITFLAFSKVTFGLFHMYTMTTLFIVILKLYTIWKYNKIMKM